LKVLVSTRPTPFVTRLIPWYRWAYPAIERTLLRASNSALKVGVAMLAMGVTVLATGDEPQHVSPGCLYSPKDVSSLVGNSP
jgi:hypothetical protein